MQKTTVILIAVTARYAQADLVHVDRHFDMIADQMDLQVESFVQIVARRQPFGK